MLSTESLVQNTTTATVDATTTILNSNNNNKNNNSNAMSTTISHMLEYDIDNTLNALKENGGHLSKDNTTRNLAKTTTNHSASTTITSLAADANTDRESHKEHEAHSMLPPTPPATPNLNATTARKRWRILAKVLRKDSEESVSASSGDEEERTASVRRFKSFDLLRQDSFEDHMSLNCLGKPENWYKYRVRLDAAVIAAAPTAEPLEYTVNIHQLERHLTASDLMGFNNTGNICVWPSEEALTAFVLSDLSAYRGKWILELGGGFTCLTGLMLAKYSKPYAVHLTDGNEISVENVRKTICLNELSCYTKCSVLKWQDVAARSAAEAAKFEVILSADCLFFDEARAALVDTIWYYLAAQGVALIMAPRRGKTLELFVTQCAQRGFRVALEQRYNETIWQRHLELKQSCSELYDEDLHYPLLIRLSKAEAVSATN